MRVPASPRPVLRPAHARPRGPAPPRRAPPTPPCAGAASRIGRARSPSPGPGRGLAGWRGKMAAAAGAGAACGLPGPVAQGLKEALVDTLTGILSPVQEVRAAAEEQIKVLEVTEGECGHSVAGRPAGPGRRLRPGCGRGPGLAEVRARGPRRWERALGRRPAEGPAFGRGAGPLAVVAGPRRGQGRGRRPHGAASPAAAGAAPPRFPETRLGARARPTLPAAVPLVPARPRPGRPRQTPPRALPCADGRPLSGALCPRPPGRCLR